MVVVVVVVVGPVVVVVGLPQSLWAAADTMRPWSGPGGVDRATPDTYWP